jgi:hypothetical protein
VCTHDAGTVLRHRLVLDQQRLGDALDGSSALPCLSACAVAWGSRVGTPFAAPLKKPLNEEVPKNREQG